MLIGKPVIVSSCRPLQRIVEETRSGVVFQAGNPAALAEAIQTLDRSAALRAELGAGGRKAAMTGRYTWSASAAALLQVYDTIGRDDTP